MTAALTAALALGATGLLGDVQPRRRADGADVHVARRLGAIGGESRRGRAAGGGARGPLDPARVRGASTWRRRRRRRAPTSTRTPSPTADERGPLPLAGPSWVRARAPPARWPAARCGMVGSRLWLARYWDQEEQVARELLQRSAAPPDDLDLDRAGRRAGPAVRDRRDDDQRAAAACSARDPGQRARRRAGHRQDHHGQPVAGAAARAAPVVADRAGRTDRQGRRPARGGGAVVGRAVGAAGPGPARRAAGDHAAPAARLAAGRPQPIPARPHEPAAGRGGRGRRDLDGVADDDGAPARGAATGHPAGAGRRPRPAGLRGGRCGAR